MAQKTLYDRYKKIVSNFIKSKYSVVYNLEDDVSEIMIRVFLNLKEFDSTKSKFKTWVFSIAKNYMIDKWRCGTIISVSSFDNTYSVNQQSPIFSNIDYSDNTGTAKNFNSFITNSNCSISSCNTDFENCSSINYLSSQLSAEDFTLLDMKYVQGYDYCEIGMEFNVTSSTISNRVNYIKTKLKKNNPEIIYD
jgi:RNA polymerase sigma factor (sigma-70 family)